MYTAHLILLHFAGIAVFKKMKVYGYPTSRASLCLVSQSCSILCDPMDCSPLGSSVYRDYPGKDTGVGCHALLQGLFPIQGSNPGLSHHRQILYHLSHQGSPSLLLSYVRNQLTLPRGVRKGNCCLFLLPPAAARVPINPCLNFLCDFLSISID